MKTLKVAVIYIALTGLSSCASGDKEAPFDAPADDHTFAVSSFVDKYPRRVTMQGDFFAVVADNGKALEFRHRCPAELSRLDCQTTYIDRIDEVRRLVSIGEERLLFDLVLGGEHPLETADREPEVSPDLSRLVARFAVASEADAVTGRSVVRIFRRDATGFVPEWNSDDALPGIAIGFGGWLSDDCLALEGEEDRILLRDGTNWRLASAEPMPPACGGLGA
ncbi:MAG: hypothetical protein MI755_02325 [Sphingomonadales bacterium]|nr:hypothetical protein [Sphingomonadales bacterium]